MIEIISYWFFIWFLLFIFGIIKQNPFWILVISYIITFFEFLYLKYKGANYYNIIKFLIINIIIKFIPILIILIRLQFKIIKININDFKFAFFIILIYLFVMISINRNPIVAYKRMLNSYINNDNKYRTIFSKLYDDIYNFWNNSSNRL